MHHSKVIFCILVLLKSLQFLLSSLKFEKTLFKHLSLDNHLIKDFSREMGVFYTYLIKRASNQNIAHYISSAPLSSRLNWTGVQMVNTCKILKSGLKDARWKICSWINITSGSLWRGRKVIIVKYLKFSYLYPCFAMLTPQPVY